MRLKIDVSFLNVVIVTNDVKYAKNQLKNMDFDTPYEVISGNAVDDINVMMSSKHLIVSNSTFALMAAIERKNKGITILPKVFFDKFCVEPDDSIFFL